MDGAEKTLAPDLGKLGSLRQERDRFVALAFCAADILLETDSDHKITFAAGATVALTGHSPEELAGTPVLKIIAPGDRAFVKELIDTLRTGSRLDPVTAHLNGPEGISPPLSLGGYHIPDLDGRYFFALRLGAGAMDPEVSRNLTRDNESGLLVKDSFAQVAARHLREASKAGEPLNLTLLKMNDLDALRARLDAEAGAALIGTIGACLRASSVSGEAAGLVDDESYGVVHKPSLNMAKVRQRIEYYARDADPEGKGITVSGGTMGADVGDMSDTDTIRALLYAFGRFADDADGGKVFDNLSQSLATLLGDTSDRMTSFRQVVVGNDFEIAFQPIVEIATRKTHHYEALARFGGKDSDSPYDVITFAEATGLICDFDLAMCRRIIEWLEAHPVEDGGESIAANLSGRSLGNVSFVAELHDLLSKYPGSRSRLIFEITESARIPDLDMANRFIQSLRQAGHKVCLDDFGAGAAAFQYLRALEVDIVKIDGEYLKAAFDGRKPRAFLKAMAALCRELKIDTIGEMVEDIKYLPLLKECHVRFGQGYLFGRPETDIAIHRRPATVSARRFKKPR